MEKKRIVVTGLGVTSCLGHDPDLFFKNLLQGQSGIKKLTSFPVDDLATQIGGEITDFDAGNYLDKKLDRRADPCIKYAMVAGKKALEHAKLPLDQLDSLNKQRCGIIIGSGMGGMKFYTDGVQAMLEKGMRRISPFFVPYILTNMPGGLLAIDLGFMGPNYSISTACATGTHCLISAVNHIRSGEADLMLCGGAEAAICPVGLGGFMACKALSTQNDNPQKASRPFDKERDGFVIGEGAGVLVLESLEHAQKRGAPILAEVLGGAINCDAYHFTEPRSDGLGVGTCVKNALADAGVTPEEINYVNAHATSTPAGDMAEIRSLKTVFQHPEKVMVSATKSMIGHALGAAGALEAVATVQSCVQNKIHPTINLENPEDDIGFEVPVKMKEVKIQTAISNSFGFGGHNACAVFRAFHG